MKTWPLVSLLLCLFVLRSAGQDMDSLTRVIDNLLNHSVKREFTSSRKTTSKSPDTKVINDYLDKAERYREVRTDSFKMWNQKALDLSVTAASPRHISLSLENLGDYFLWMEDYSRATACFLSCLKVEEARGDQIRIADLNDELGTVYYYLERFEKSLVYSQKALDIYKLHKDTLKTAMALSHIGSLHSSREFCEKRSDKQKQEDFDLAIRYFQQAMILCQLKNDQKGVAGCNLNIGAVYNKKNRPETAKEYIEKALPFYRKEKNWNSIVGTLYTLGKTFHKTKEYVQSIACFEEAEKIGREKGFTDGFQFLYEAMAQTYYSKKDFKNAYEFYIRYMTLRDSVYNAEKSKQVFELETRYQSKLKENEILKLTLDKRHRNQIIWSLAGLIVLLFVPGYFMVRMNKKNRIIAEQTIEIKEKKIEELEKERRLIATQSVLQGEEDERSRIASDLHDGLGGLLSGIKINLSTMKENAILTHENVNAFSHAISLLDNSISELKRIAHNLMPETLNNQGLKPALEDFCFSVRPAGIPKINFDFFGSELRFSRELELTIYRIAQELVNNALKHAAATSIRVQLFSEKERICLEVTDNGKGFQYDPEGKNIKGNGLMNIRNRVNALNGKFDCWSRPGEGTEINVEFDVYEY